MQRVSWQARARACAGGGGSESGRTVGHAQVGVRHLRVHVVRHVRHLLPCLTAAPRVLYHHGRLVLGHWVSLRFLGRQRAARGGRLLGGETARREDFVFLQKAF